MTARAKLTNLGPGLTVRFAETLSDGTPNGFYRPLPIKTTQRRRADRELLNVVNQPSTLHHAIKVNLEPSPTGPQATARVIGLNDADRLRAVQHHLIGFALEAIAEARTLGKFPGARGWLIGIEDERVILTPGPHDLQDCLMVLERAVARLDEGA